MRFLRGSRWLLPLTVAVVVAVAVPGVFAVRKYVGVRRLGTPVQQVTSTAAVPAPLQPGGVPVSPGTSPNPVSPGTSPNPRVGWQVRAEGRITDAAVLPRLGLVLYVEEVTRRVWRATAVDARTGAVRWSNQRGHTGHIEAWTVTDSAVVLAYHHSASRLAWRTHKAASLEGLDPATGRVMWTRPVYNLLGERPGDYAPTLASPADDVVFARTEFGVVNAVDTRTGETLYEHPGLHGCDAHEVMAGPAGVALSQRCPNGKERVFLLDPRTGKERWKLVVSTPELRLLAVGASSVAFYQGGMVQQVVTLGPTGGYASHTSCECGAGGSLVAGVAGDTVLVGGGPLGLLGIDGTTGSVRWQQPMADGPVRRVLAQDGEAHLVTGGGALVRVEPGPGTMTVVLPGSADELDPGAIVVPVAGYLAAGSAGGFAFSGGG